MDLANIKPTSVYIFQSAAHAKITVSLFTTVGP